MKTKVKGGTYECQWVKFHCHH